VVNLICDRFFFGWRISLSLQIVTGFIIAFGMLLLPETPRYYTYMLGLRSTHCKIRGWYKLRLNCLSCNFCDLHTNIFTGSGVTALTCNNPVQYQLDIYAECINIGSIYVWYSHDFLRQIFTALLELKSEYSCICYCLV